MAKCTKCSDGTIVCGPNEGELCGGGGGWEFAGLVGFKLYVRKGPSGACKVQVVPVLPPQDAQCVSMCSAPAPSRVLRMGVKKAARTRR